MLTISPEQAQAFERETLARWKRDIAAELVHRYPQRTGSMGAAALDAWVRGAIEMLRDQGGASLPATRHFALVLFALTEATPDERALGDLLAILSGPGDLAARLALLAQAFPEA